MDHKNQESSYTSGLATAVLIALAAYFFISFELSAGNQTTCDECESNKFNASPATNLIEKNSDYGIQRLA